MGQKLVSPISVVKGGSSVSWSDGIPILGDIINYFSNKQTNAANAQMVADTNAANERIAQNTNAMNQAINEQNIALTREQNQINRDREDNAVRRRVNDLIGAGLSKTLAAGSPASANAMAAPQATQGMQTGHEMKSAKYEAFRSSGLAASASLAHDSILAAKEFDLKSRDLDLQEQRLNEDIRHNKEMEGQGSRGLDISEGNLKVSERYLEQQDKWNKMYYDQNSEFHKDAVRLEESAQNIQKYSAVSQAAQRKAQELWYQADIDLMKITSEQNAKRLTADLAESSARIAEMASNIKINNSQRFATEALVRYYAASTIEALCRARGYNAEVKETMINYATKVWNLMIAGREHTTTTSSVPSDKEVEQIKKNRIASWTQKGVSTALSVGAGIFLGSGGGKLINKMLGMDDHNPIGFIKNR